MRHRHQHNAYARTWGVTLPTSIDQASLQKSMDKASTACEYSSLRKEPTGQPLNVRCKTWGAKKISATRLSYRVWHEIVQIVALGKFHQNSRRIS